VIEKRPAIIAELEKTPYLYIEGDASNEEILLEAQIEKAKVLVSVIDNDSDGLYTSLAGKSMNPNLFIIARATENQAKKRMLRAGADRVILPFVMSGLKVAECVLNPAVEDLFDISGMQEQDEDKIQLADLFVTENSRLVNLTLSSIGEQLGNLIVVGVKNKDNEFQFKPGSSYVFKEGDCIITLASKKTYDEARLRFRLSTHV
jgi:voltage-gated potassium channel